MKFDKIKKKIIIGAWSWSGMYKTISQNEVHKVIDLCLSNQLYEFDTSPSYKKADKFLSDYKKKNSNILINSKCGWNLKMERTYKVNEIKDGINKLLDRYDKLNVLQLHNPRNEIKNWDEIIEMFNDYKKKKLINYSGISLARNFYFPLKILNKFDFIQDEFNLLRIDPIYKMKKFKNILAARSLFANGILTNNFSLKTKYKNSDHRNSWLKGDRLKNIYKQKKLLEKLSKDKISKFATNFALNFKMFDKYIFGFRTTRQFYEFYENINSLKKIDFKTIKKIKNLNKKNRFFLSKKNRYNN